MPTIKTTLFSFVLLLFAILSCYFFYRDIFSKPKIAKINQSKPDIIIKDITSNNFNAKGNIETHVSAPVMTYDSYNKQSLFLQPTIIVYQAQNAPWIITANKGSVNQNTNQYKLIGNVLLSQGPSQKSKNITITTSKLTIYPKKHIAETHQAITFTQLNQDNSKIIVKSVGALVNQKTSDIKLFSKAKGIYNEKS